MVKLVVLLFLVILTSCSSMKSGQYIQVKESDTIDSLAKEFHLPKEKIMEFNHGKSISPGDWIFIPTTHGILAQSNASHAFDPNLYLKSGEYLWPVPSSSTISSGFGTRWGKPHEGVDIPGKIGSHIVAAAEGVVVYSGKDIGGYGNITVIAHRNGFFTVYAHAKKNFTHEGQRVYRGQVIAVIGMTGRTYGPHLHFEMRKNGEAIDPSSYIAAN